MHMEAINPMAASWKKGDGNPLNNPEFFFPFPTIFMGLGLCDVSRRRRGRYYNVD